MGIRLKGPRFVDARGRTLLLRGMNLGAGAKMPSVPDGATHRSERFFEHREVSFVDRPLPLAQADEHLDRLRSWGFTHLRLAVTWEAIEHSGPGAYDAAYLDYVEALVDRIGTHHMTVQVDTHQDVWSRFTGGSGAPGWTLEALGIDLRHVHETGAAFLHQVHGDPFPRMIWPTNSSRLAAATMFTVFFGGTLFAPHTRIDGEPAQDFLQRHYCAAVAQVAARLRGAPHVLGYETMNEPHHGFIGMPDLGRRQGWVGDSPTPFQSMLLAAGIPQTVPVHAVGITGIRVSGRHVLNPRKVRLWIDGAECPWRLHGVWDIGPRGQPRLLRPDYFAAAGGRRADFSRDFYRPFANRFAAAIRSVHPEAPILVQTEIGMGAPRWEADDARGIVFAPHWYDPLPLVLKRFHRMIAYDSLHGRIVLGPAAIRRSIAAQIAALRAQASDELGNVPFILGETGIPFDLRNWSAVRGSDRPQVRAVDRVMRGIESAIVSSCWWNYAAENDRAHGDQWNGEDFSVYSADRSAHARPAPDGGRALAALVRPCPIAIAGEPLLLRYAMATGSFLFTFRHEHGIPGPTEIFVPRLRYPRGYTVTVSDGTFRREPESQLLLYEHTEAREVHEIRVRRVP